MQNYNQYKKDLNKLISIKSVMSKKETDAPFGKEVNSALEYFLSLAKDMGFETKNYDGYGGEVIFGEGEEIGIVGHLDVVPEGDGWKEKPYSLTEKDGYLYGRGIMDDKGPMLLCLYALKELKDGKVKVNKKFRLIVGVNEESGWKDIEYIKTKTTLPEYGFSPDGDFPVGYAEKGMAEVEFSFPKLKNFHDVKGGTVVNAVCGLAEAKQDLPVNVKLLKKFKLKEENGKIVSVGKSAHGSRPKEGKNAILPLLKYFKKCGEDVDRVIDCLFLDKCKLCKKKNEQGYITLSPDIIKETKGIIKLTCDLRVPAPFTFKTATDIIDKFNIPYKVKIHHEPMMVDKNGFFVKSLLSAYNEKTKKRAKPVSMGGSTFARVFNKGCAFGPEFPLDISTIHGPDEKIKEDKLLLTYEIYKSAIFNLAK